METPSAEVLTPRVKDREGISICLWGQARVE